MNVRGPGGPLFAKARRRARELKRALVRRRFERLAGRRLRHPRKGTPHAIPGELIVSLTSYPARFASLHLTLACLLDQSVEPDRVILWIAHQDIEHLPAEVRRLEERGLEIRTCEDLRSYKKLVPALETFPDAFIVTADDDLYYPRDWLETLVESVDPSAPAILCHRAHRMTRSGNGEIAPYLEWEFDVQDERAREPSVDLVATGVGGILYPPHSLDSRVTDRQVFQQLAPDGDDLWFYWCARSAGTPVRKAGKLRLVTWRGSQQSSLWSGNEFGGNDRMIAALEREFARIDQAGEQ